MPKGLYKRTQEIRQKISNSKLGHIVTDESRLKMSKAKLGRSSPRKGIKLSKEARKKLSLSHIGKRPSIETRRKMGQSHKGSKCNFWKGGLTLKNAKIRQSFDYKLWRETVFKRDNYTCVWCKNRGVKLNADHIKPFALYPELRFAIDNGRTLCVPCHKTTDTFAGKIKNNRFKL